MSETASLNEIPIHFEVPNEGGESSGRALEGPLEDDNDCSGDHGAAPVSENSESSFINSAATSLSEESEGSAVAKGKQSDEIENLVALFRHLLEVAPNPATFNHTHTQRKTAGHKRKFFGLNKGLSLETGTNNRYYYEQKYPRDRFGEDAADNARIWLTYLDEAESFDRERVDGWKETADVLLVFAGLFSGVITTFVSQASQSLQQDNTQVSASLLYEITQLLRAQSSGTPLNNIPSSTLTPTSQFTPSTNAFLVNGLWFTSLAIALSTALFAVLAKQWLYYYLTSITGTANEKVRARQLRFNGFELWKVGAIVDLLPILLHLAVGMFLIGIIILLFPLDIRIAWTIVIITGITYLLYFISVILPIRYPECPYTTSLTIYVGVLVFSLKTIVSWISATSRSISQVVGRKITFKALNYIQYLLQHAYSVFQHAFIPVLTLAGVMRRGFGMLRVTLFTDEFPRFTKWREENIKKAVKNAAFLDFEALDWLYVTSPNRSVHRIIARCAAVHPSIGQKFGPVICDNLLQTLEISETNVVDLRYGLCLDIMTPAREHWNLLRYIPDVEESHLEEAEYRSYSHIADNVVHHNHAQVMKNVINNDLELPLVMWSIFFERLVPGDATIAARILTSGQSGLFEWRFDPTHESIRNAGVVSLDSEELGWRKFEYLYCHFFGGTKPDYSSEGRSFETHYRLLVSVYRNLTSDQPLIADGEQRKESLSLLFHKSWNWLTSKPRVSSEQYFAFFKDICCADVFWSRPVTPKVRESAVWCLNSVWASMDTGVANQFLFMECDDLSPIYRWCSRDLHPTLSRCTTPMFALLLMPRNRDSLCTLLSNDPDAVSHFSNCFRNTKDCRSFCFARKYMYPNLMDLVKSVDPLTQVPLFTVLYSSSVLVQLWKFLVLQKWDAKKFLVIVKTKLDREKLDELHAAMNEQTQLESDKVFDYHAQELGYGKGTDILDALETSAREFEQIIGVSHPRLRSTIEDLTPEHAASPDKDHDTEERAQVSGAKEHKGFHSIVDWTKKAFGSVWPKTSVE